LRVIEGYGALPAFGLVNRLQVGDTGPAESTRQGNLQRVGLLFLGSRDRPCDGCKIEFQHTFSKYNVRFFEPSLCRTQLIRLYRNAVPLYTITSLRLDVSFMSHFH
jgi:hypothetical protein